MRSLEGFVLPALVTLLLHAGVLVLVSANWNPEHERLVKPIPRHHAQTHAHRKDLVHHHQQFPVERVSFSS